MAVWNDFKDAGTGLLAGRKAKAGYSFSIDGGLNWTTPSVIPEYQLFVIDEFVTYTWGFDPSCAFARNGYAYYCYVARRTDVTFENLGPIHLSRTNNNGSPGIILESVRRLIHRINLISQLIILDLLMVASI